MVATKRLNVGRGRDAVLPQEIPRRGWRDIVLRVWEGIFADHITIVAAGVAFYALLALFPAIAATIAIWAVILDPAEIEAQIAPLLVALPLEAAEIITSQVRQAVAGAGAEVGLAAIGGLLFALFTATQGVKALIEGLNIVYNEAETRSLVWLNLLAFGLTLGLVVGAVLSLSLVMVLPALIGHLGLGETGATLVAYLRWPILFTLAILALAFLYRFAPCRRDARWQWVSIGAVVATVLWLAGSVLFSLYVSHFARYNEIYGALGAVVILLMWFWLSALIVLVGAELNAEMEHQTARDTTEGRPKPMGERGAYVADTLGETR